MKASAVVCAVVVLVLSFLLVPAPRAAAGDPHSGGDATIVLKTGETVTGADIEVDRRFQVLRIKSAAGERSVSFADVVSITVAGEDVTEATLGRSGTAAAPRPAVSRLDESFRRDSASPWQVAFDAGLNLSAPVGQYYEGINAGLGFEGRFLVAISRTAALRFGFSRSGMEVSDRRPFYSVDPGVTILSQDFQLDADRYVFEVQVHRYLKPDQRLSMIYGYAGLGVINHAFTLDLSVRDNGQTKTIHAEDSVTNFLTDLGGGVVIAAGNHLGIDLGAHADLVWLGAGNHSGYTTNQYAWVFDVRLGAVWFF